MSEKAGALSRVGSLDTSLEQALSSLPTKDQYNAVLESLVARRGSDTEASVFDLVKEMNAKRIRLSDAAITALINYGVETTDAQLTLKALLAARANGALRSFASPQATLSTRPAPASFTGLPEVPTDARVLEVSAAGVFLVVAGGILLAEIADLVDFILPGDFGAPPAQVIPPPVTSQSSTAPQSFTLCVLGTAVSGWPIGGLGLRSVHAERRDFQDGMLVCELCLWLAGEGWRPTHELLPRYPCR